MNQLSIDLYWNNVSYNDSVEKVEIAEKKTVNIVNTNRETVNEASRKLSESLEKEGIRNNKVNTVESC
ncbi:21263_t:CDS:2 [Gigaspora margarita]|uniref:21263_t:CDS:1 n=1 Tax=Gigaspora margarita TaxID=4874 RepID=A0ABM8W0X0_GIGMA|nr:21263_t:CDS:2 [Gigaspora margarita]